MTSIYFGTQGTELCRWKLDFNSFILLFKTLQKYDVLKGKIRNISKEKVTRCNYPYLLTIVGKLKRSVATHNKNWLKVNRCASENLFKLGH